MQRSESETNSSRDPLEGLAKWLDRWSGGRRAAPDAQERIGALESRYGICLPDDFRRYLLEVAPPEELWDDAGTIWWPLDRIRNIPEEYRSGSSNPAIATEAAAYLFFADYLAWCWAWAICCSDGPNRGRVAFIGGPDGFVADSFSDFVERYRRDPDGTANTMPPWPGED